MIRKLKLQGRFLTVLFIVISSILVSCQASFENRPTAEVISTITNTSIPTSTATNTLVPTITLTPTQTSTSTVTPFPTRTMTPTKTQVITKPAVLFDYYDGAERKIGWDYVYISRLERGVFDKVISMSAIMAFQLQDCAIRSENILFLDQVYTSYYLNVVHDFDGKLGNMKLVIGGTNGKDIPLNQIPADGSAYLDIMRLNSKLPFEPWNIDEQIHLPFAERQNFIDTILLSEFQSELCALPEKMILLAVHPIIWPEDEWPDVKQDMSRVSSLAVKYFPYFEMDIYNRLDSRSKLATSLMSYLLENEADLEVINKFSSEVLIIVTP